MPDKTGDLICWIIAALSAPFLVSSLLFLLSIVLGPLAIFVGIAMICALIEATVPYLILAAPLMGAAHLLGWHHPVWHVALGFVAVGLHFPADMLGLPGIAPTAELYPLSYLFPLWCGASALFYAGLTSLRIDPLHKEYA